jgi:hypothetical protein
MASALFTVFVISFLGSLSVPLAMLLLSRLGLFEPISFAAFGRVWDFRPRWSIAKNVPRGTLIFPQRPTVGSAATALKYTAAAPAGLQIAPPKTSTVSVGEVLNLGQQAA